MNRIKELLQAKGVSQISCKREQRPELARRALPSAAEIIKTELAHRLGKCFNTVNLYATNRLQPPIPVLYRIADILEVDVRELLVPSKKYRTPKTQGNLPLGEDCSRLAESGVETYGSKFLREDC